MADFESNLRWLSERGNPVGAEELIGRIEADLAGNPLVVVAKRREGQSPTTGQPNRYLGPAWALAAFVVVLGVTAVFFILAEDDSQVADDLPPPETVAPNIESMTDLETIEAGVAAFYSGHAERAVELFELPDRADDEIRQETAYQAAIGGRLNLTCTESTPGTFSCSASYQNAITDVYQKAMRDVTTNWFGPNPLNWFRFRIEAVVEDGVITDFMFPEYPAINLQLGAFLVTEGRLGGYEDCAFGPLSESCAVIQLENLDDWAEWRATLDPASLVDAALRAWHSGDCLGAHFIGGEMLSNGYVDGASALCPPSAGSSQTIEYESILEADVSVEACEEVGFSGGDAQLGGLVVPVWGPVHRCEVHYSNAMNAAVGKPPTVKVRAFHVVTSLGMVQEPRAEDLPWYQGDYFEDTVLRESFRRFAEGGELQAEYADAGCGSARTPECASLVVDSLDEWAAWYATNG